MARLASEIDNAPVTHAEGWHLALLPEGASTSGRGIGWMGIEAARWQPRHRLAYKRVAGGTHAGDPDSR